MDPADVAHRFQFHPADDENTKAQHERVRQVHLDAANAINEMIPDSREKSLAITALETSSFWANAAVARGDGPKT